MSMTGNIIHMPMSFKSLTSTFLCETQDWPHIYQNQQGGHLCFAGTQSKPQTKHIIFY